MELRVWQLWGGLVFQLLSLGDQDFFFLVSWKLGTSKILGACRGLGQLELAPMVPGRGGLPGFLGPRGTGVRILPEWPGTRKGGVHASPWAASRQQGSFCPLKICS